MIIAEQYICKWYQYPEYCELCNEHHKYIYCPLCNQELAQLDHISFRDVYCPKCDTLFCIWNNVNKVSITLIECEHLGVLKMHPLCWHNDNLGVLCQDESCPIK